MVKPGEVVKTSSGDRGVVARIIEIEGQESIIVIDMEDGDVREWHYAESVSPV